LSRSRGVGQGRALDVAVRASARAASTAGVYRLDHDGGWRPTGGAVCFRVAGRPFVLSSGGVLAPGGSPLWLGARRAVVPIAGAAILADGPGAPPEVATLDVAFGLLAQEDGEALADELTFLSLKDLDLADGRGDDVYHAVSANRLVEAVDESPGTSEPLRLRPASASDYCRCGVTPVTHLVLRPAGGADADLGAEAVRRLPGCGVWRSSPGSAMDPLAGIVSGGGPWPTGCLVATRPCFAILGIMGFLGAGLPEISAVRARH
jgi:hypothetical protein